MTTLPKWPEDYLQKLSQMNSVFLIGPMNFDYSEVKSDWVVFVDGGSKHHPHLKSEGIFVGDGDSSTEEMHLKLPENKDVSDLGFVLQSLPNTVKEVQLWGFSGGRIDHQLAVFGELNKVILRGNLKRICVENKMSLFPAGTHEFETHQSFSLMTFKEQKILIEGEAEYCGDHQFSAFSSLGISNKGSGVVKISSSAPVLVIFGGVESEQEA